MNKVILPMMFAAMFAMAASPTFAASPAENAVSQATNSATKPASTPRRISQDELLDRIEGGWAGQMIGNIQGLPYEFKFHDEPGPVPDFTPDLPECPSDDDTDIEIMHLLAMDRDGTTLLPYPVLAREWVARIHGYIWIANERARNLMREGVLPPWTSHPRLNEHSSYNLSGQFCAETYGLIAPGMAPEAGRIGVHYTLTTVRGEPLQSTAWSTALVSGAFFEDDVYALLDKAAMAVDPESQHAEMLRDVKQWWEESPDDWRPVRAKVHQKYLVERGWNWNATITNGALTAMAFLYGEGDFQKTLQLTFALGYDADNNAALCGATLGAMLGAKAMKANDGWSLPQRYVNKTRDEYPKILTMYYIKRMTLRVAERVIEEAGGRRLEEGGRVYYEIPAANPEMILELNKYASDDDLETTDEKITAEAVVALGSDDPLARGFAAIRVARMGGEPLADNEARVRRILQETMAHDTALNYYADLALQKMEASGPAD